MISCCKITTLNLTFPCDFFVFFIFPFLLFYLIFLFSSFLHPWSSWSLVNPLIGHAQIVSIGNNKNNSNNTSCETVGIYYHLRWWASSYDSCCSEKASIFYQNIYHLGSVLQSFDAGFQSPDYLTFRALLPHTVTNVMIAWVPGHHGIIGNEIADNKAALTLSTFSLVPRCLNL